MSELAYYWLAAGDHIFEQLIHRPRQGRLGLGDQTPIWCRPRLAVQVRTASSLAISTTIMP